MKRVITSLSLLLLLLCGATAQSISQYEYWTDDDYANRTVSSTTGDDISLTISTETLEAGVHFLNFRACRDDGEWGNFYRYLYYIPTLKAAASGDVKVEYWLDDNYASKEVNQGGSLNPAITIGIGELSSGVHYFNCRAFNERGEYGNPVREMFYIPSTQTFSDAKLASYEYWFDDDYAHSVKGTSANADQAFTIDVSQLSSGVHYFNYWPIDDKGRRGNVTRQMFYLAKIVDPAASEEIDYEYWIDSDTEHKVTGKGTTGDFVFNIDVSALEKGTHTFNFRAKRVNDDWGPTFTAEFDMSEITVIEETMFTEEKNDVYNLAGSKIKSNATYDDLKALPRGIYIFGGKKILVP